MRLILPAAAAIAAVSAVVLYALVFGNAGDMAPEDTDSRIIVYGSFFPYAELARAVAGPDAEVRTFIASGADVHDWEPEPRNIVDLAGADVFVYNGLGVEPYLEQLAGSEDLRHVMFVNASDTDAIRAALQGGHDDDARDEDGHEEDGEDGHDHAVDPHVWADPVLAISHIGKIQSALAEADPANAKKYESRAKQYISELEQLDSEWSQALSECRLDHIVTFHSFLEYAAERYGFEEISVAPAGHSAEPSASEIASIIDTVVQQGIGVIFSDELDSSQLAQTIAEEAGVRYETLSTLETITRADMDAGHDYLSKSRQNIAKLAGALQCQ